MVKYQEQVIVGRIAVRRNAWSLVDRRISAWIRLRILLIAMGILHLVFAQVLPGQDFAGQRDDSLESRYETLNRSHREKLARLAERCEELEEKKLAEFTRNWNPARDPSREYFFLGPETPVKWPKLADEVDRYWKINIDRIHAVYAAELMELAREANRQRQDHLAYRLLYECLAHDPANRSARKILGLTDELQEIRVSDYKRRDPLAPSGKVRKYESANFEVITAIDSDRARAAVQEFETWQLVWRQLFFDYWASDGWLARRFSGEVQPRRRSRKFRVVLYRDRQEYLSRLQAGNPGIEVSVGYYLFPERTSFFYVGDDTLQSTWIHELTHQFMHETIPGGSRGEISGSIWAVEGIALYMESLQQFPVFATVGGEDAARLNFCRHNYYRRGFMVGIGKLNSMGQREFVQHSDVRMLYSLAGAYSHFLMSNRKIRGEWIRFLRLVHQGKNGGPVFDRILKQVNVDEEFLRFLKPSAEKISRSLLAPDQCQILYLGGSQADDELLAKLAGAKRLESLDLGGTKVTDRGMAVLSGLDGLRYLSLERTGVTDRGLSLIGGLEKLEELDLTTTAVTDQGLGNLSGLKNLQALWLGGTRVSDAAVDTLLGLPALKQLDIRKTEISERGRQRLETKIRLYK